MDKDLVNEKASNNVLLGVKKLSKVDFIKLKMKQRIKARKGLRLIGSCLLVSFLLYFVWLFYFILYLN